MKKRTKLIALGAAALALGIAAHAFTASSQEAGYGFGPPFMHHGMSRMMGGGMGAGPGMMRMGHDSATMAQLGVIHELIANHDRIRRTVTNLPDGIRTVTESDDPKIAEWIKTHVADMGRRVDAGDDPGLPIESPALHAIFRDKDKIRTTVETTDRGVAVVQTSSDAKVVAELQEHASEVTDLVRDGMAAVHTAMMRNAGGAMHGGMMPGAMMHGRMGFGGMMRGPN
jgi:hypothetical protein